MNSDEARPVIPVIITGDSDFTRAIFLLKAYSFPVLLVRPEHAMVNADFLVSTPHQLIWGSNESIAKCWSNEICIVAETIVCLGETAKGQGHPKMTAVITDKINEILGWLWNENRHPNEEISWRELVERSIYGSHYGRRVQIDDRLCGIS